ncbi:protease complex subunit PrcB family protein [Chryseobacterium paridis]|uniref:Protease complex subunit PrcB family protein n=1 Tax=Chryseobacterium paridis TaxID=2800328 RepID=A0ABS1FSY8_9FLAO|nr:protease complex subunit PrcB family protein [Chryseobacterium paridis]MBK1895541.1 protease complex subunit PrcB family protein [Chryseobacterium paridis]
MNKLFIWFLALFMSCTSAPSSASNDAQKGGNILVSESQGGTENAGFSILKNDEELQKIIKGNSSLAEIGKESTVKYPTFPKNQKAVLYNLGTFRSGDHKITEIKSLSLKDNVLYVEVPQRESGGMEIQVISNPWVVFTVPSNYQFNSVVLKYSK